MILFVIRIGQAISFRMIGYFIQKQIELIGARNYRITLQTDLHPERFITKLF